ncbi:hypothetical protein MY11210_001849 [Beauveria gryllotalpidicola]
MPQPTTNKASQAAGRHPSAQGLNQINSENFTHHVVIPDRDLSDVLPPLGSADDADSDYETDDAAPVGFTASLEQAVPASGATHSRGGGDAVLMLGLPDVFTVGCDTLSFTAKHFGGLGDVPAGPHFFWAAHPSGMATRSGFWIVSEGANRVHAVRWDSSTELLTDAPPAETPSDVNALHAELLSYRDPTARSDGAGGSVGEMNESRAAESDRIWSQLTSCITSDLLSRVTGQPGAGAAAWHMSTTDLVQGQVLPSAERAMEQHISHMWRATPARELRFTLDQHSKTYSAERLGAERTREATDATTYLLALLDSNSGGGGDVVTEASLVGELQLAFLAGVHLGNDACLEQWQHTVLRVLLRAYALPRRRPTLAADALRAVTAQLAYGGSWLDTPLIGMLSEARGRELRLALIIYKRRLEEDSSDSDGDGDGVARVTAAFSRLEAVVAGPAFGWDLRGEYLRKGRVVMEDGEEVELEMKELQAEDERGEWAPEIVELDEHGREKGLISWNE